MNVRNLAICAVDLSNRRTDADTDGLFIEPLEPIFVPMLRAAVQALTPERRPEAYTCDVCDLASRCKHTFDARNVDGDCLLGMQGAER